MRSTKRIKTLFGHAALIRQSNSALAFIEAIPFNRAFSAYIKVILLKARMLIF